jgi:hypothetical protein
MAYMPRHGMSFFQSLCHCKACSHPDELLLYQSLARALRFNDNSFKNE